METLLIDDEKNPLSDPLLRRLGQSYPVTRIARNFKDGVSALAERHWDVLLLDHDLADFTGEGGAELTGRSVVRWLAKPENRRHFPGRIICVSRNVVGHRHIEDDVEKLYSDPDQLLITGESLQELYETLFGDAQ